ncbi:MAG: hypothetical protein J5897_04575, partial [Candidatus Methanomethylophilus sp.]|nr:hypothetical protein [Methanomethylophilus sp.]
MFGRSSTELLRYGFEWMPKFAYKCLDCEYEIQNFTEKCPHCGGTHLRKADLSQSKYFRRANGKSFIDEVNDNGQSLKDIVKAYIELEYQDNQAYMLCVTGDILDGETKELIKNYPMEFLVQDPKYVKFLYDETGKIGTQWAFTRDDRHSLIDLDQDPDALNLYDEMGRVLYPACWQIG